jgi:predicted DCC family thiol-disulfide oxidoreductase YuxK
VLFFDGVCGLCNSVVDFILEKDRESRFKFSPLQSNYAAQRLTLEQTKDLKSLVLIEDGKVFEKSDAVIRISMHLGGFWHLGALLRVFPKFLRDLGYRTIAANRYRWFGKKESCRFPTAQERERFIMGKE